MDFGGWPEKSQAEYRAERAVIEAAKVWKMRLRYGHSESQRREAVQALVDELDALQELEGGVMGDMADWNIENGLAPPDDGYDSEAHELEEARNAVIEAAKAVVPEVPVGRLPSPLRTKFRGLRWAVRDLQELEGE